MVFLVYFASLILRKPFDQVGGLPTVYAKRYGFGIDGSNPASSL